MGIFQKIKDGKFNDGGVYLLQGVYVLKIKSCKQIQARAGWDGFVAEFEIIESSHQERLPGSTVSWMVKISKAYEETAMGNIAHFLSTAAGCRIEQITEEVAEVMTSDKQPLAGRIVRATATDIKTKKGDPFTKVKFDTYTAAAA